MNIKIYLSSMAVLASVPFAEAREAELTHFAPLSKHAEVTSVRQPAIAQALRNQLEALAPSANLSDESRASLYPEQAGPVASLAPCLTTGHSATWWLPRTVEARRAAQYAIMAMIACEAGVPVNLLDAVIAQESGYRPWAVSSAGAMGMMQIMPATAHMLGLSSPFEPIANMRAGARYLRQQIDRFGRIDLALAAYNAGPERKALKAGYIPAIPETRHYVLTILTNWERLAALAQSRGQGRTRGELAMSAVRAAGYREIAFTSYVDAKPRQVR